MGESFRPVAHPYLVKGAYAVSWAYIAGDVAHEGYKAYLRNQRLLRPDGLGTSNAAVSRSASSDRALVPREKAVEGKVVPIEDYRAVMAQRAVFQSIASMGLPAFTIHTIVRYAGRALKDAKNQRIRSYGPIGVRFLPSPFSLEP